MRAFQEDWQIPGHWFDYFKCLEVKEDVTDDELKKACRRLTKKYHPDRNQNNPDAEEKFKNINIAYEVLSDKRRRQDYYEDYKKRKEKANSEYTAPNKNNNQTSQSSQTTTSTDNNSDNNTVQFSDILNDYKSNPNDQNKQNNLRNAITIVLNSFKTYSNLVDETYKEFYNNISLKIVDEPAYLIIRDDLLAIIKEQVDSIQNFQNENAKYMADLSMLEANQDFDLLIDEYKRKLQVLSKPYKSAIKYANRFVEEEYKKYFKDRIILEREFEQKIGKANEKFIILKRKTKGEDIPIDIKQDLSLLSDEYQKILDWILNISNIFNKFKNSFIGLTLAQSDFRIITDLLSSYQNTLNSKINEVRDLINNIDNIIKNNKDLDNLISFAEQFLKELSEYHDCEKLSKMIDDNTFSANEYKIKQSEFRRKYSDFLKKYKEVFKGINIKKESELKSLKVQIESIMDTGMIFKYSWDALINVIEKAKKRETKERLLRETEIKAEDLLKKLKPAITFIMNIKRVENESFNDFIKSTSFKSVDSLIELCEDIINEMKQFPYYELKKDDLSSKVFSLNCDSSQALKTLKNYKKCMKLMASFEEYIACCRENITELGRLYSLLQEEVTSLVNDKNYSNEEYKQTIDKINLVLKTVGTKYPFYECSFKFYVDDNTFDEQRDFINGVGYFYSTRRLHGFSQTALKSGLDVTPYREYRILELNIQRYLKANSLENIEKARLENQLNTLKNRSKSIVEESCGLIDEIYKKGVCDWLKIASNKKSLNDILNEINLVIAGNAQIDEDLQSLYWELYQEIKLRVDSLPDSKEELTEIVKLQALDLFKNYSKYKKEVSSSDTITDDLLCSYINSLREYLIKIDFIQLLNSLDSIDEIALLEKQIEICQRIIDEIISLKSKNSYASSLETEYNGELYNLNRKLFYAKNSNCGNVDLLWQLKELKAVLENSPASEEDCLKYLKLIGTIAGLDYLASVDDCEQNAIKKKISELESLIASLKAEKQALCEYIKVNNLPTSFLSERSQQIEASLDDCTAQLNILTL